MRVILMAVLVWCGLCAAALAEVRIALVIGNGAYTAVNGLPNPPNDAKLMADTLQKLGFNGNLSENDKTRLTEIAARCPIHKLMTQTEITITTTVA